MGLGAWEIQDFSTSAVGRDSIYIGEDFKIEGRLVDEDENPVPNYSFNIYIRKTGLFFKFVEIDSTDIDGRFTWTGDHNGSGCGDCNPISELGSYDVRGGVVLPWADATIYFNGETILDINGRPTYLIMHEDPLPVTWDVNDSFHDYFFTLQDKFNANEKLANMDVRVEVWREDASSTQLWWTVTTDSNGEAYIRWRPRDQPFGNEFIVVYLEDLIDYYAADGCSFWYRLEGEAGWSEHDRLELRTGTPTVIDIIDLKDEYDYYEDTVIKALLTYDDGYPIRNERIDFQVTDPLGGSHNGYGYTNDDGIAEHPDEIDNLKTWISDTDVEITAEYPYTDTAPYLLSSEDRDSYSVVEAQTSLTYEIPYFKQPDDTKKYPSDYGYDEFPSEFWIDGLPPNSKIHFIFTFKQLHPEGPISGKQIDLTFYHDDTQDSTDQTDPTDSNGQVEYEWTLTTPRERWRMHYEYPGDADIGYAGGNFEVEVGATPTKLDYEFFRELTGSDNSLKPGETGTFRWRLLDSFTDNDIPGEEIALVMEDGTYGAHSSSPQITDSAGWATYSWTPTVSDIATWVFTASFVGDAEGNWGASTDEQTITVEKGESAVSLIDPVDTIVIDKKWEWRGTLLDADTGDPIPEADIEIIREADWLTGWEYRKEITIDSTKIDSDLTDFPILIKLTSSNFEFTRALSGGEDIRFTQSDGTTLLTYERERHNVDTQEGIYWVKIPSINYTSDTKIYLYYGNNSASDGDDYSNVWTNGYGSVYHLNSNPIDSTPQIKDSTDNNDATSRNIPSNSLIDGKIGKCLRFDGDNDYIIKTLPINIGQTDKLTISAWVKIENQNIIDSSEHTNIIGTPETGGRWTISTHPGYNTNHRLEFKKGWVTGSTDDWWSPSSASCSPNIWEKLTLRMDRTTGNIEFFKGEDEIANTTESVGTKPDTDSLFIGKAFLNSVVSFFKGTIEEVRISEDLRDDAWIKASYHSENNSLVSIGGEEEEAWQRVQTSDDGGFIFTWTPDTGEVGVWDLTIEFEGNDGYESSTTTLQVTVEKKTGSTYYEINHIEPVPEAQIEIEGCLLRDEMDEKGGETIRLLLDDVEIATTTTSSEIWDKGEFSFSVTAPTTIDSYTYKIKWDGDEEYKPVTETQDIDVTKETPSVVFSIPDSVVEYSDFLISIVVLSFNGGTVEGLSVYIKDLDTDEVINSGTLDSDGFLRLEERVEEGTYNWGLGVDSTFQFNSIDPSSESKTFYGLETPDLTRPKFEIRVYDSDDVEKTSISPLTKVSSFKIKRNVAPEADTFELKLDNKDTYYSDKIEMGDRVAISFAYEPIEWSKISLALKGIIEETKKGLSVGGEILQIKGQDYFLYLKNAIIDKKYDGKKTPYYLLTDSSESIFIEASLDDDFDFEIVAPKGWSDRGYYNFDNITVLDCLKMIKDNCEKTGLEYEFFVKSKATKPLFVFRPKVASPLSSESLEVGRNVSNISIKDDISNVKNKIKVLGASLPHEETESFNWSVDENEFIVGSSVLLEHGDIVRVSYVALDGVEQVEGRDYEVNALEGSIKFLTEEPMEDVAVEIRYEYRKRIVCEGGIIGAGSVEESWWKDTDSIENVTWGKPREMVVTTELEEVSQLDDIAKAVLLAYKDPIDSISISTTGMFLTEAGYETKIKYTDESIDEYQKIATLNQSFDKGKGFVSKLDLKEIRPEIGSVIASIIGEDVWWRVD